MSHTLRSQRLGALFAAGWLLLNFPLVGLWDSELTVLGIPLFPLALFGIWGATIATVAWWMESRPALEAPAASVPEPLQPQAPVQARE